MAWKIEQDDRSAVYQLDVIANRYRSWVETRGAVTTTKANHYSGDGDSPSWTDEGDNTATRSVFGVVGMVGSHNTKAGLTSSIINLHGDVVAGMAGSTPGLSYTSDPSLPAPANPARCPSGGVPAGTGGYAGE